MKTPHIRQLSDWDVFLIWWETRGELMSDLVTYYGICSAFGLLTGWNIGTQMVRYYQVIAG